MEFRCPYCGADAKWLKAKGKKVDCLRCGRFHRKDHKGEIPRYRLKFCAGAKS